MIQITPQMKILVAIEAVDGRKGIDSLARLCEEKLQADPFSGCMFSFEAGAERRSVFLSMMARDSGWRRSVCRRAGFSGGRVASKWRGCWKHIKRSYC